MHVNADQAKGRTTPTEQVWRPDSRNSILACLHQLLHDVLSTKESYTDYTRLFISGDRVSYPKVSIGSLALQQRYICGPFQRRSLAVRVTKLLCEAVE